MCREPVRFALCLNQCPNNRREPDGWCQHGGRGPVQTAIPASSLHFATTHLALADNDLVKLHAGQISKPVINYLQCTTSIGKIDSSILVVAGVHCRLESITEDRRWINAGRMFMV